MCLKTRSIKVLKPVWLACGLSLAVSSPYAANFYTIIGPDGHPIIVQKPPEERKKSEKKHIVEDQQGVVQQVEEKEVERQTNQSTSANPRNTIVDEKTVTESKLNTENQQNASARKTEIKQTVVTKSKVLERSNENVKSVDITSPITKPPLVKAEQIDQPIRHTKVLSNQVSNQSNQAVNNPIEVEKNATGNKTDSDHQNFTTIDGVKYVNNEYLEDKEFNLEGKKRFYMTPEVGTGHNRFETIERQKGLNLSLFDKMMNKEPVEKKPIVLSSTYYRLPKNEVVQNLEQTCFSGKKLKKAKDLSPKNQEVGIWPVAPFKERFTYEVVKLDTQVQNVLLTSYASSKKDTSYYWPLAVFLDDKGCVMEGVSGFKNEDSREDNLQFAAMEGVLKKPEKAVYLFLTPLSSAVDVENKQLTNHGQIKLSIIQ